MSRRSSSDADPRTFFGEAGSGSASRSVRRDRKTKQLCKEVLRTLSYAFLASDDPLVRDLTVVDVEPAPDASRLLVTVDSTAVEAGVEAEGLVRAHLERERGALREQVAWALDRKRT